jgi:SAM-dependent methyltransferase
MVKNNYNNTDLNPLDTFEKHIFHRDQFAHYLRWTHILKEAKIGETIVDFGAGKCNLLEVLYRNRFKPAKYIALEYKQSEMDKAKERYSKLPFEAEFIQQDIIIPTLDFTKFNADRVVSFEVAEHVGTQNVIDAPYTFLKNFMACGSENATYYLSTPNFDARIGAAGNHTYDSGDGLGKRAQELDHDKLQMAIENSGFEIINKFGTFASQKDYKDTLNSWQLEMFNALSKYYDSNLLSNFMAPVINAKNARNCLWVLKRKK